MYLTCKKYSILCVDATTARRHYVYDNDNNIHKMTNIDANHNHYAPIKLEILSKWLPPSALSWLKDEENERIRQQRERDEDDDHLAFTASLFRNTTNDNDDELEWQRHRIRSWMTSATNPDGIFDWMEHDAVNSKDKDESIITDNNSDAVHVIYIMSDSSEGHGNTLWPSSRHVSNLLGNRETCRQVLSPLLKQKQGHDDDATTKHHPLLGLNFIELGAGAGVPSWTAMRCGARVVCTDQAVPDRIRCMAECAYRNYTDMCETDCTSNVMENAILARACPYNWGDTIDDVMSCLDKNEMFDVIVAADCCYMPLLQTKLLQSIKMLMSKEGVALLPFALHSNASDDDVWGVIERAKCVGFEVEILSPEQLNPTELGMDEKRSLVQTIRLTKEL